MTDSLYDDVKALLDKDFGDDRILKQIYRACENNEVISNYERNYVRQLAEKHLGKKSESTPTEEKPPVPDVVISPPVIPQKPQTLQVTPQKISSNKKNSKIMLGLGGVAIAIIIVAAISFNGLSDVTPKNITSTETVLEKFFIQTDFPSYNNKDIISINGVSDTTGTVDLSIKNQNNKLVWTEQVSLKNDGRFSTLTIAGGPGWESSGTYTIIVDNGREQKSNTFSFTA